MGDRSCIYVRGPRWNGGTAPGVFLYSHWGGSDLPEVLSRALNKPAGRSRIADDSHLTRIIFCQMMVDYGALEDETGFGIAAYIPDNDGYPILAVDSKSQRVYIVPEPSGTIAEHGPRVDAWIDAHPEAGLNVEEYIAIATEGWKGLEAATQTRLQAAVSG